MASRHRAPPRAAKRGWFTLFLVAATLLGVAVGWACNSYLPQPDAVTVAADLSIVTDAFLRLIRMIIAPLVFATLVSAIARMGSLSEIGRIGLKTLVWFFGASCVSLTIGLLMAHWLQPGAGLRDTLAHPAVAVSYDVAPPDFSFAEFITHLIPRSIIEAMAGNEILQIVVFSLFVGVACASLKGRVDLFVKVIEQLATVMFKVTDYVMKTAPLAIFAALASTICLHGIGIVGAYARYVGGFYLSLGILWALLIGAVTLIVGRRGFRLVLDVRQPTLLAFSTASSEAAYPSLLEKLVASGIPPRIASFVLPLGYSFNLDGAMMYCTFAILFVAQAYGVELTVAQQIILFGLLMVSTKGLAGVPRAAIAVLVVMLHYFHLPDAGMALILGVDHILDMGRSATNIVGNSVAAAVVASWEGKLEPVSDDRP